MKPDRVVLSECVSHLPRRFDELVAHLALPRIPYAGFHRFDEIDCHLKLSLFSAPFRLKTASRVTAPWKKPERLREFENLARLRASGFDALEPLIYAEQRRWGFLTRHLLVTRRVPESVDLHALALQRNAAGAAGAEAPGTADLSGLMARVGATIAAVHRAGFCHRDLYPRNLLVAPVPRSAGGAAPRELGAGLRERRDPAPPPRIIFLDCRKGTWSALRWLGTAFDVACFDLWGASLLRPAEREAFFAAYLRGRRLRAPGLFLRRVERARRRQFARHAGKRSTHKGMGTPASEAPPLSAAALAALPLPPGPDRS
jgi:hypothetical protein